MSKEKPVTVETSKTRKFASRREAAEYARGLAVHGQISNAELRSVESVARATPKGGR